MNNNNPYKKFTDDLVKDPDRLKAFLLKVLGPPRRTLEGKERDQVLLLLEMAEPYSTSNNQHSWTSCYMIGNKNYHVTTFPKAEAIVDEMLEEKQ
jgi:hypothetical protein